MLCVGKLAEVRQERAELHDDGRVDRLIDNVEDLLDDVISELVLCHLSEWGSVLSGPEELSDDGHALVVGAVLDALLDDVGCELVC